MTDNPGRPERPPHPDTTNLNDKFERDRCWLELDRAADDAALLAWVKRWREGIRAYLSDREFPR